MNFLSPRDRRATRPVQRRFRPQLYALENRCLLSALMTGFQLPDPHGLVSAITSGPEDNLWFIDSGVHKIGRITPAGVITEFRLPANSNPVDLTAGPDGNLWFTDNVLDQIGRITPSGLIAEYPLNGTPVEIVAGHDGSLWFTLGQSTHLGRLSVSGSFTDFNLGAVQPGHLTAGADGNIWFFDSLHLLVGRVTPAGDVTEFSISGASAVAAVPLDTAAGSDGNVWFTEGLNGNQIGQITPSGTLIAFDLPQGHAAFNIRSGLDGNLWFTEQGRIGRLNQRTGILTEFGLGSNLSDSFAFGTDGNLWFADGNSISKLDVSAFPPVDVTNISLVGLLPSVTVILSFSSSLASTQGAADAIMIDWGDGQTLAMTISASRLVGANHTYTAFEPFTIEVSVAQPHGVLVQLTLRPGYPNPTSSLGGGGGGTAATQVFETPGGFFAGLPGGGVGAIGLTGNVTWHSLMDHGASVAQGAPAVPGVVVYRVQPMESMTGMPLSQSGGPLVVLTIQVSSGTTQGANYALPGQPTASSRSTQTEVFNVLALPVLLPVAPEKAYGTGAGTTSDLTPETNRKATTRTVRASEANLAWLSDTAFWGGESNAQSLLRVSEIPGPALVGEPLTGNAPAEQDLLLIAHDILASNTQRPRANAGSSRRLEGSLIGIVLGLIFAESLIWSSNPVRCHREEECLPPAGR